MLGKKKAYHFLEAPQYWLEDKAKTKHRKKMSNKAFKGTKRLNLVPLSEESEEDKENNWKTAALGAEMAATIEEEMPPPPEQNSQK